MELSPSFFSLFSFKENLKSHLNEAVVSKSHKHDFKFDIISDGTIISRFRPSGDVRTDAVFSVDDDVIIPCPNLDFASTVWQSAPSTMVGFVPRAHLLEAEVRFVSLLIPSFAEMNEILESRSEHLVKWENLSFLTP